MTDLVESTTKNGRNCVKGKCSTCGCGCAKMMPGKVGGSVASAVSIMGSLGLNSQSFKDSGAYDEIKGIVDTYMTELKWIMNHPEETRIRNIYVERVPRLGGKFDRLGNKITFLNQQKGARDTKARSNKVARVERKRANVVATVKVLLARLPRLIEYAQKRQERDDVKANALTNKEISLLEKIADKTLNQDEGEDVDEGAEWLEEDGGPVPVSRTAEPVSRTAEPVGEGVSGFIMSDVSGASKQSQTRLANHLRKNVKQNTISQKLENKATRKASAK